MALDSEDMSSNGEEGDSDLDGTEKNGSEKEEGEGDGDELELDEDLLEELAALSDSSSGSTSSDRRGSNGGRTVRIRGANKKRTTAVWYSGKRPYKITPQTVLCIFILSLYMARIPFMLSDIIM